MPEVDQKAEVRTFMMSADHKALLAAGREQSRAIRRYLNALEHNRPRRGRPRSAELIRQRLQGIDDKLAEERDPLKRLALFAEREKLEDELDAYEGEPPDLESLEKQFVEVVVDYSRRKGISWTAWRAIGVEPAVLKRAGLTRAS